jgi:hypothetical protein
MNGLYMLHTSMLVEGIWEIWDGDLLVDTVYFQHQAQDYEEMGYNALCIEGGNLA